jgi:hypothetical protein
MTCAEIEDRVALYAGGELDAESARDVQRHAATCPACQGLLDELREQRETMAEWRDAEPSEDALREMRTGVLAGIARGEARPGVLARMGLRPSRPAAWGLTGLAAAALLVFAVWTGVSRSNDVPPATHASARPSLAASQAAVETAGRTVAPAPAERRAEAGGETSAPSSPAAASAAAPVTLRPRPATAKPATAGATIASVSRRDAEDLGASAAISDASPGPVRRIEFQTADPNIRIIWLMPGAAPDPERTGEPGR